MRFCVGRALASAVLEQMRMLKLGTERCKQQRTTTIRNCHQNQLMQHITSSRRQQAWRDAAAKPVCPPQLEALCKNKDVFMIYIGSENILALSGLLAAGLRGRL